MESSSASVADHNIRGTPTHSGRYVQYNVYGNVFEVSRKYVPPIRPVGRGAYGIVCAAVNAETHEEVAIKKIGNAFDNRIDAKRTLQEIKLLRHMDHENVISIKDIIRPPQKENFNDVYIVYELMDTDLHQIIRSNQSLTDDHCRLLQGLKYVHSASVLHRDLKSLSAQVLSVLTSSNHLLLKKRSRCLYGESHLSSIQIQFSEDYAIVCCMHLVTPKLNTIMLDGPSLDPIERKNCKTLLEILGFIEIVLRCHSYDLFNHLDVCIFRMCERDEN